MGLTIVPQPVVFVRYIGVFVLSVGLTYLWAAARWPLTSHAHIGWSTQWKITALVRTLVAVFVVGQIASSALEIRWISVALSDGAFAMIQWIGLRKGWLERAAESSPMGADARPIFEGWQGVLLVAGTYVYFLIFAQFGFLKRLAELGITENSLPLIMGAMAIGGVGMSLFAPRFRLWTCPSCRLQAGLIGCALSTVWSLLPLNVFTAAVVAMTIGLSLGLLTVTLVANLPLWIGIQRPLLKVGLGTGIGYFLCIFPPLFRASPQWIALTSTACCLVALIVANRNRLYCLQPLPAGPMQRTPVPFALVLVWFTALVWLDSAAFYIIQNSPWLKAGTWQGDLHLWRAGTLHFAAALVSAWLLARRGVSLTLALALTALGAACLLLLDPARVPVAAVLYPLGVSLYSVALVAYPSFLMPAASHAERARAAGYLYAVAGWVGSALGIGMGRNLHHVPILFVAAAAALFLFPGSGTRSRRGHLANQT